MTAFDDAFEQLMGHEGGYANHPDDPGGETMWGITARVARAYGYKGAMRDLPQPLAKEIAKKLYWAPLRLDEFDPRVAFQIFDAHYNGGRVVLWMQQASGARADSILGRATIAAVQACHPLAFVLRFNAARIAYLVALKGWTSFGKGWASRIALNLIIGAR